MRKSHSIHISCVILTVVALLFVAADSGFRQAKIPDTPAGKVLGVWLDAFNSGDEAKIEAYIKTHDLQQS